MKTKKLLSIAIIAALPFAANADYGYEFERGVSPLSVESGQIVMQAGGSAPYQTATIDASDAEHIASTAYVKGAYNDTIAAVNSLDYKIYNVDQALQMNISSQRVSARDTWGSNHTANVALVTVSE